jgi:ABC-type sugar transport system ATPase subunit
MHDSGVLDLATSTPALELRGAAKAYGRVVALERADLHVRRGEVLGIVGDNGAGKSTMLKILSGLIKPDSGELRVGGELVTLSTPADARRHGISTVYQDLALVECLDVATNMFLGMLPSRGIFLDRQKMRREAENVLVEINSRVASPTALVGDLSGGQRQIVAIARAVRSDEPIVLLDEPTAALGVRETAHVAEIIRSLKSAGKAVICISHDMEFVLDHMDRVVVMRNGYTVAARTVQETSKDEVIGLITGAIVGDAAPAVGGI